MISNVPPSGKAMAKPVGMAVQWPEGRVTGTSIQAAKSIPAAKRLGVTPAQCVGLRCYEVVHGTADVSIPMERAEALAAGLPGCPGVVRIEHGTHAANLTHPDLVNEAILTFLDGLAD